MATTLEELAERAGQTNIAERLNEEVRGKIAGQLLNQIEADDASRQEWLSRSKESIELAAQVRTPKSFPWNNASNVKYPLLTISATQFHARAQQSLVNENGLVQAKINGRDPDGTKKARGNRVATYMTYQLTEEMDNWIDETDRLLLLLPLCGICYRKTYFSPYKGRNVSDLVLPQDLIVSYYAKDFETARKTHIMELSANEVVEYQRSGIYLDIDVGAPSQEKHRHTMATDKIQGLSPVSEDSDIPFTFYESHAWYDLDDDGYKEPYIITICKDSGQLVRMVARFDAPNIETDRRGDVVRIPAKEHFTNFVFMPDPQSATHGIGLGHLMGSLNHSVNTIINQLTDAGTLSNLQSGFLGRGIKMPIGGSLRFKPGEWKSFPTAGDDLRKNIYPLPVKEPSTVLFQLLGLLIKSGENAGSIADIMLGENPGQNQPYSTTLAVIEQGQKVFVAIYKRLYRSLKKEYKRLYILNSVWLDMEHYKTVVDDPGATEEDWETEQFDISPAADPNSVSDLQKLKKAEGLMALAAQGLINPQVATRRFLEALGESDIEELLQMPEQQPTFEQEIERARLKLDKEKNEFEGLKDFSQAMKNLAGAEQSEVETGMIPDKMEIEAMKASMDQYLNLRKSSIEEEGAEEDRDLKREEIEAKRQQSAGTN